MDELCPWDDRRLPRELYVKFFVIHFVVIGAYSHLRHLRGEKHNYHMYFTIALTPLTGLSLLYVPLVVLFIQAMVTRCDLNLLRQSIDILLGSFPSEVTSVNAEGERQIGNPEIGILQPISNATTNSVNVPSSERPFKISKKVARSLLIPLALLSQSITSIWLFIRRAKRGSDALYDQRVLHLSLLGLSVSIKTIIHIILMPRYPFRGQISDEKVRWLFFLRPDRMIREHAAMSEAASETRNDSEGNEDTSQVPSRFTRSATQMTDSIFEWVYLYGFLSVLEAVGLISRSPSIGTRINIPSLEAVSIILPLIGYIAPPLIVIVLIFGPSQHSWAEAWRKHRSAIFWWITFIFSFAVGVWFGDSPFYNYSLGAGGGIRQLWRLLGVPKNAAYYTNATYVPLSISVNETFINITAPDNATTAAMIRSDLFWSQILADRNASIITNVTSSLGSGSIRNVTINLTFWPDWDRIWAFGKVPTTFPCPKAWKDPVADYVWWLA